MGENGDIVRRYKCDVCGKEEYTRYIGTEEFDGGYTTLNKFEPTSFIRWFIDGRDYYICPECRSVCIEAFNRIMDERRKD